MNTKIKILTIIFILSLISIIFQTSYAAKCNIGSDINLKGYGSVEQHVRNVQDGVDYLITTDLVGYYDGTFYPAYCLNRDRSGADNGYTHTVNVTDLLPNDELYNKIWRVAVAGYPYHTAEELGVDNWKYAYQATKMAIYHILGQTNIYNYYGVDDIGNRTVALMRRLVEEANNGTSTYKTAIATIKKAGSMNLIGEEYVQNFDVKSNVRISAYIIETSGFPEGTRITDKDGNVRDTFFTEEQFQIRVPKDKFETLSFSGNIKASVQTKSCPIFYGTSYDSNLQDYAIVANSLTLTDASLDVTYDARTAGIKIKKVDKDTKKPISGVTYELTNKSTGELIGTGTTDAEGNLIFDKLVQDNYVIKEVKTDDNYIISQETINIRALYNKVTEVTLENEHKKGNLKIYKVDKDNNNIALGGVEFELYSEELGKIVGTYITNQNGEIYIENLRTGNYKLHETVTNEWYNFTDDVEISISSDETEEITVENELIKAKIKVVKVDKDNQEIKLQGVEFDVFDKYGNYLETIETDELGEAYTKGYPIRDYQNIILREKKTLENYSLDGVEKNIEINSEEIETIIIANEKKKGQIKIVKLDKDNHEIKLEGVKFEVYDEENNLVQTLVTNKDGEAETDRLPIDKTYTIKEIETNCNYLLNEDVVTITLEENEIKTLTLENEKKKGQIQILKVDSDNNEIYIPDVTFEIYNVKGEIVDIITTNTEGKAISKPLPIDQEYTIKETISNKAYVLNEKITVLKLETTETATITIENEKKKGQIKIVKLDKDNHEIKLEGVKFEVYDEENNLVQTLVTNKDGEAETGRLPIDKTYTIKEIETNCNYVLNEDVVTITLEENEIKILTLENEKKKGQIQVLKVDSENNEIYIPDVTFEIYNAKGEIVDTITTNADGKAISKLLPIDQEYTIKETISNKAYVLNEEIAVVKLQENEVKELTFENTKKYGKIKINKISSGYSKILDLPENSPLANTKFLVVNEKGEAVGIYTTDETGSIVTENLSYGTYTVYEYETPEHFLKDANPQTISITEDNQIIEITFKNAPKEPELPKTGF